MCRVPGGWSKREIWLLSSEHLEFVEGNYKHTSKHSNEQLQIDMFHSLKEENVATCNNLGELRINTEGLFEFPQQSIQAEAME